MHDVVLTDASHVFVRPLGPFLAAAPPHADVLFARGRCRGTPPLGCDALWHLMLARGSVGSRRPQIVEFVRLALTRGMLDFYLRWWAGHHCIFMGYTKLVEHSRPLLVDTDPEHAASSPNQTNLITLNERRWCRGGDADASRCLTLGMMPRDLFPPPGAFPPYRGSALVGRSERPSRDHRLRLDRYDERDFTELKAAMVADGLWLLPT